MKMLELLEADKDRLINRLEAQKTIEKASREVEEEIDRILLLYNEKCDKAAVRDAAANMLQAVKLSAPLTGCISETKVYKKTQKKEKQPLSLIQKLLLILTAICAASTFFLVLFTAGKEMGASDYILLLLLLLASPALSFLFAKAKGKKDSDDAFHTENLTDAEKIYRTLHNAIYAIDWNLDGIALAEDRKDKTKNGDMDKLSSSELELFSGLLEAAASGDGHFALDKINGLSSESPYTNTNS